MLEIFKYKFLIVVKKRIDKYINNEWGNVPNDAKC